MQRFRFLLVAPLVIALLAGCDVIFTWSPVSGLRGEPTPEEALASGDKEAMAEAYASIRDEAFSTTDGDLELLAAQLALELSGLPDVMTDLLAGDIDFADGLTPENEAALNDLIAALDASYVSDAAALYPEADGDGGDLDATDYLMGALAVLADVTVAEGGDVSDVSAGEVTGATDLLAGYLATADPGDPSYNLVNDLNNFLLGLV